MPCPDSRTSENPIRLDCPLMTQWLLESPERLVEVVRLDGRSRAGRAGVPPGLPVPRHVGRVAAAERNDDPVESCSSVTSTTGAETRNLCAATNDADCDGFVVDGIHSVGRRERCLEHGDQPGAVARPSRAASRLDPADVDRLSLAAVPSFEILSRVALPGHRIRELEPALGTGALSIIDRPIAWVVTGLDASAGGSAPVRRTFLIVDGTAEAYETVPWEVDERRLRAVRARPVAARRPSPLTPSRPP